MIKIRKIVNSIFSSNTYYLENTASKYIWLIDAGDEKEIFNLINKSKKVLKGIFITHSHIDHIYGLNEILDKFSQTIVYTSTFGRNGLLSDKINLSRYNLNSFIFQYPENIKQILERDQICLWENLFIEVYSTPGHDKSCLTYKIGNNIFTGDSYIPGLKTIVSFPNSNKVDAKISEQRIARLSKGCNLYPGHGNVYEV